MQHSVRKEKLAEYMKRSMEMYLRDNPDVYENVFVLDSVVSEDMKRVTIVISSKPTSGIEDTLNNKKGEITDYCKRYFSVKYLPQIKFVLYENLDI